MVEYLPLVNLLLEALAYLGRRAAGNTAQQLLERLRCNGVTDLSRFREQLSPIADLMAALDRAVPVEEAALEALFGNLPGFPFNTIGSYSPVFLLLYPTLAHFDGSLERTAQMLTDLPQEELAGLLALSLEVSDEARMPQPMTGDEFTTRVLALSIPAESKVSILDLYHRPQGILNRALPIVERVLECLRKRGKLLDEICQPFSGELQRTGLEHFIAKTSGLNSQPDLGYSVRPFLFGMDTNLAAAPTKPGEPVQVYCGILRGPLQEMLTGSRGPEYEVYNAFKLLGDQTRFDILCYLRNRSAYGQELSARFGLSRNTIHHHMSKLLAARLVTCTVDGNRVYYTIDRQSVNTLLEQQRLLLLGDS